MRTFIFLCCTMVFALSPDNVLSQNTTIKIEEDRTLTVDEVFDLIINQTDYKFFYEEGIFDDFPKLKLKKGKIKANTLLKRSLSQGNFEITLTEDNIILIKEKANTKTNKTTKENLQEFVLSGTVTDESGQPLPGANIIEKGTSNGAQSNFDGQFTLTLINSDAIIVVSYLGFKNKEVPIGGQNQITIVLTEDAAGLDEVVVIGYGTAKRSDLTGAVARADLKSFEEAPNTNILQSVSGSLPGLTIGQNPSAGEEPRIQVRGQTSINGNQNPLIVVDGAIYRGSLNDLNPSDISSIDVLKDASSKAIYGAQAANGVLIVTTKGGKKNQATTINYSSYYSVQSPSNNLRTLNRDEFLEFQRDLDYRNGFLGPDFTEPNPDWDPLATLDVLTAIQEGFTDGTDSNWFDELTSDGFINNHQLSFTGGAENVSYFISGGYTKQENWILNDEFERTTVRINIDTDITPWLTLGANTYGAFSDFSGESPNISAIVGGTPLAKIRDEDGNFIVNPNGNNAVNGFLTSEAQDIDKRNNISGVFYGIIKVPGIEGLTYRLNYSNNYRWQHNYNSNIYDAGLTGGAFKDQSTTYDWSLDNILNYNKEFGEHTLGATLVAGRNKIEFNRTRIEGTGFDNLDLGYHSIPQAAVQSNLTRGYEESFSYQMARLNYGFKDTYLLTATMRRDGYSGFAANEKIGYFPSIGLSWVLSNDLNLGDDSAIDQLKFRASYGASGNLTNRFQSLAQIELLTGDDLPGSVNDRDSRYIFGDGGNTLNGQSPTTLANPNLTWETTTGLNFGIDFSLWNYRLSGSIDYYNSETTDLLYQQSLPSLTGFNFIQTNLGEVANSGLEINLNADVIRSSSNNNSDFSWNVGLNFASNKNRIKTLLGFDQDGDGIEDDLIANGLFINESIGTIYNYDVIGLWQLSDEGNIPDGYVPGSRKLRDIDMNGTLDANDRTILGREEPAYSIGFQNTLRYKNLTLKFFIKTIQGGKDGYLGANNPISGAYQQRKVTSNILTTTEWWSPRNPNAQFRGLGIQEPLPAQQYFARDFIRLQDISIAYDFNSSSTWMKGAGIKGFKLYVSGKNLVTITDWLGWDPETGVGLSANGRPIMKSVTLGLNVNL